MIRSQGQLQKFFTGGLCVFLSWLGVPVASLGAGAPSLTLVLMPVELRQVGIFFLRALLILEFFWIWKKL